MRGLYEGRYAPGQRLIEADIKLEYGVSRGSAREALKRLGTEGLLTISLHKGARIRRLDRKEMLDILGLLEVLTGYSCRLCAERVGDRDVADAFRRHYDELLAHEGQQDSPGFVKARNRFFRAIVELSGNGELQRLMPTLHLHLIRVQLKRTDVDAAMARFDSYRSIGEAILAGDGARADAAAKAHVGLFAAIVEALPER